MENTFDNSQFTNDIAPLPEKPQFLKVLCILSFIACGLMILFWSICSMVLVLDEETLNNFWSMVLQTQPQLESMNQEEFFHQFGLVALYSLVANIFSLVGVILMWRLNKVGFFIYAAAELATHFFGLKISGEDSSAAGMIFGIFIDLIFIVLYAINLKHMRKKENA